jgi:hypothetical protein
MFVAQKPNKMLHSFEIRRGNLDNFHPVLFGFTSVTEREHGGSQVGRGFEVIRILLEHSFEPSLGFQVIVETICEASSELQSINPLPTVFLTTHFDLMESSKGARRRLFVLHCERAQHRKRRTSNVYWPRVLNKTVFQPRLRLRTRLIWEVLFMATALGMLRR